MKLEKRRGLKKKQNKTNGQTYGAGTVMHVASFGCESIFSSPYFVHAPCLLL